MLSDLSVQLLNSFLLNLWTDPFFIDKFTELLLNPLFDFFYPWMESIIDLCFDYVNISLIETTMLLKDFCHYFLYNLLMLWNHLFIFKIFSNQFLSELKEKDVFIPLFKGTVLS